ncbi:hypothetical protein [Caldibacillus debilis]|uniref:Uncharacterized protein n=1 Tax=Caldibacillus debilis GB1 TaxID=1339248 RepID=A0A420VDJ4_9BACI|nr:hypothetical protein [Caldibacillus debilis]RKO61659.1 hypothetical protein Cdeb_01130 [Caldibacillus debilis GB1]
MKERNWLNGFGDWLIRNRKNPLVRLVVMIILAVITPFHKLRNHFKREVEVRIEYIYGEDGKYPDTVRGYIVRGGTCWLFSGIPWGDLGRIIQELRKEDKPIVLYIEHGIWHKRFIFRDGQDENWQRSWSSFKKKKGGKRSPATLILYYK